MRQVASTAVAMGPNDRRTAAVSPNSGGCCCSWLDISTRTMPIAAIASWAARCSGYFGVSLINDASRGWPVCWKFNRK